LVQRSDRNSELINLMQDKRYSNSAVDLYYMLGTMPCSPADRSSSIAVRNMGDVLRELSAGRCHV